MRRIIRPISEPLPQILARLEHDDLGWRFALREVIGDRAASQPAANDRD
jgi:hypothetical protein